MNVPLFKTVAGNVYPCVSMGKNDVQYCIHNCTVEEVKEYAKQLESLGYEKYANRSILVQKTFPQKENLFYTFVNQESNIFISWFCETHIVRIIATSKSQLPITTKPILAKSDTSPVTITQTDCNGMGYVIQLPDQSFIVIDGGRRNEQDVEKLYNTLKSKSKNPIISLWLFTHADCDHIEVATDFIIKYAKEVEIKGFAYNFPSFDKLQVVVDTARDIQNINALEKAIQNNYPNSCVYTLRTGQSYYYKGVEIEILWTADDTYPNVYVSCNDLTAMFRFKFDGGKTFIVLGDPVHQYSKQVAFIYGNYLKSDIMQVAHHGLIGGDKLLYQYIDADICLWPVKKERFYGTQPNQKYQWCLGEGGCDYNSYLRNDDIKKRTHYHGSEQVTLLVK